jgi:hypothetical protein
VTNRSEFHAALSGSSVGQTITVVTELPDRTRLTYHNVELTKFPLADLISLFWLPYGVGLAYLGIGLWVYRIRGYTRPGRAFAFLCVIIAIVIGTLFGLYSSRYSTYLWTLAIAESGSMLIAASLLFPEEFSPARVRDGLRILIHLIGLSLTAWGIISLTNPLDPWAYVIPWRFSYVYTAIGILFFLGMMIYRQFSHLSAVTKQQARIILAGSLLAFVPVTVWLGSPMAGIFARWSPLIFVPLLLIFPVSFAVAIYAIICGTSILLSAAPGLWHIDRYPWSALFHLSHRAAKDLRAPHRGGVTPGHRIIHPGDRHAVQSVAQTHPAFHRPPLLPQ